MTSLTDQEVLQNILDGLSLKGILLENDCYSSGREQVLCVPPNTTLKTPILQKSIQQNEFHSKKLRNAFINSLQNGEYSFTQCYDRLIDKLDLGEESYWNKHYFGVVRYYFAPVSSFSFDVDTLTLSDRCINTLMNLEEKFNILPDDDMQKLCDQFFRAFGSHVNIGPIHFGGIFLWTSDYHSIRRFDCAVIKKASERALDTFKGPAEKVSVPELTERLALEVQQIGGRNQQNVLDVWEKYLKLERSKWSLIDRGCEKNFVRIWNLLKNHRQSFRNLSEFRIQLDHAWEKHKENKLFEDIRGYCCNDVVFVRNCKTYLQIIANSRMDPGRITQWNDIILKPAIINLMMKIYRNREELDTNEVYDIKTLIFELLGGTEDITFEGKGDLLRWINPAASLSLNKVTYTIASFIDEMITYLVPKLKEIESLTDEEEQKSLEMEVRYDFASRIKHAITVLTSLKRFNDASFLKLMIFEMGYDLDFDTVPYCDRLTLQCIQSLIDHVSYEHRRFEKLKKTDAETINFYLLGIALKAAERREESDQALTETKFKSLLSHINLEAGSRGVIESYSKELLTWEKIRYIINTFNNSNKRILKDDDDATIDDVPSIAEDKSQSVSKPATASITINITPVATKPANIGPLTPKQQRVELNDIIDGPFEAVSKLCPMPPQRQMQVVSHMTARYVTPAVITDQIWNEAISLPPPDICLEQNDGGNKEIMMEDKMLESKMMENKIIMENIKTTTEVKEEKKQNNGKQEQESKTKTDELEEEEEALSHLESLAASCKSTSIRKQLEELSIFKKSYVKQMITWGKLTSALEASINADGALEDSNTELGMFDVCHDILNEKSEHVHDESPKINDNEEPPVVVALEDVVLEDIKVDDDVEPDPGAISDSTQQLNVDRLTSICNLQEEPDETSWCVNKAYEEMNQDEESDQKEEGDQTEDMKDEQQSHNASSAEKFYKLDQQRHEIEYNKYKTRFGRECIYLPEPIRTIEKRNLFNQDRLNAAVTDATSGVGSGGGGAKTTRFATRKSKLRKTKSASDLCFPDFLLDDKSTPEDAALLNIKTSTARSSSPTLESTVATGKVSMFTQLFEKWQSVPNLNDEAFDAIEPYKSSAYLDFIEIEKNSVARRKRELSLSPIFNKLKEKRNALTKKLGGGKKVAPAISTPDLRESNGTERMQSAVSTPDLSRHAVLRMSENENEYIAERTEEDCSSICSSNNPLLGRNKSAPLYDVVNVNKGKGVRCNVNKLIQEIKSFSNLKNNTKSSSNTINKINADNAILDNSENEASIANEQKTESRTLNHLLVRYPDNQRKAASISSRKSCDDVVSEDVTNDACADNIDWNCQSPSVVGLTNAMKNLSVNIETSALHQTSSALADEVLSPIDLYYPEKHQRHMYRQTNRQNTYTIDRQTDRQNTYTIETGCVDTFKQHKSPLDQSSAAFSGSLNDITIHSNSRKEKLSRFYSVDDLAESSAPISTSRQILEKQLSRESSVRGYQHERKSSRGSTTCREKCINSSERRSSRGSTTCREKCASIILERRSSPERRSELLQRQSSRGSSCRCGENILERQSSRESSISTNRNVVGAVGVENKSSVSGGGLRRTPSLDLHHTSSTKESRIKLSIGSRGSSERPDSLDQEIKAEETYTSKIQILDRLGLITYFPSKITLSDVRRCFKNTVEDLYDVPWFFLSKILMLDYNGRNMLQFPLHSNTNQHGNLNTSSNIETDLDALFEISTLTERAVNPMDVVVAVALCSDYFLRQLLAQKLYMCRLSIPLLIPKLSDEYELQIWPLRGISLGAECENDSALSYNTPIVSFLRFGDLPQSKSKLLNDLLSDQSTDTFFHKDCGNGSEKKVLSYGLIDAAWFIPTPSLKCICKITERCKCNINQLVMFLNLHGNCKDLDTPRKFMCKVSNIVTVLVDVRKLKNVSVLEGVKQIADDTRKVLLILTNEKHHSIEHFKESYAHLTTYLGRNKDRVKPLLTFNQYSKPINLQKLKENIRSMINQMLSEKYTVTKTLAEQFKYIYIPKIRVDEEDPLSKSGHSEAYTIYAMMNDDSLVRSKERYLPLQGDLWKEWGELERDMKRGQPGTNQSYEHYVSGVHMKQMIIRDKQVMKYWESNRVMQMIVNNLKRLKGNNRRFYIHWLRYYLDELSRKHLPQIRLKLQKKWSDLTALQQKGLETNYKSEYDILKTDIRGLEKSLERASLGLEHIFREIGQIYEAFATSDKADVVSKRRFESIPLVMAELLLQGYTVEIMDGNARQVPMTFIKAVFHELDQLIKGNVFVLSVLGLQSSGKSTLLNAMFGVQFSTSAGRCTQGVNAQLVSMPSNIVERYGYEYIMLIDTEGLRSADLGDENRQRDNELATLAVGLGDLSIINVKGENQTELNDVLQIVVHALLKIKMVNKRLRLQSSCFFVHQNVGAIDAEAKLLDEQMKLAHKLDAIAVAAAAQTGHHDITSFSKIIEFDVQRDIRYFCDLWQGNPPMAPTNPGYSKKVRDVKTTLLETIIPRKDTKTNMTSLTSRLEDLWSGILDEDFVFSFKNSQEIKAYTILETEYNNIKWELKERGLIWLNDIKLNMKGSSSDAFSITEYQIEVDEMMETAYEEFARTLATFCKKSNERNILEQWRVNYQLKLKVLKDETVTEIIKMLKDDIQIRKRQIENDKRSIAWREAFRKKAIDLAKSESSSDVKLSSEQMKTVFEGLWEESLKELPLCTFDGEDNIELIVTNYLKTAARPNHQVFQHYYDCLKAGTLDITTYFQPMEKYIMKCDGFVKQMWRSLFNEYTEKVEEITQRIFKRVNNYAANIKQKNFSKAHVEKVVELVTKEIEEWNGSGKMFELTAWYKVEILVKVGEQIKPFFINLQENFKKKVDPRSQLEAFKSLLLTQFMDTFEKIKQEKTIAKLVSQVVENAIKEKMNIDLPRDLANDVRTNNTFMLSKKELLIKVLTDLADEDEFLEFMKFVDNTNEFLRGRLRRYTNDYLFGNTETDDEKKFSSLAITRCEIIFANVAKNLQSMRKVLEQPNVDPNIEEWVESFTIAMKNTIPVTKEVLKDIIKDSLNGEFDIKVYDEFLIERFSKLKDNLKAMYTSIDALEEGIEQQVNEQLAGSVLGCSKQCPFCRVSCTLTVNDHDVDCSSPQHYPKGVAGYHWTMNKKLAIDTCTTAVASDLTFRNIDTKYKSVPFKDYKKFYNTWKIQGDKSLDASLYWKWFMAKYLDQLAAYYKHEIPDIPEAWNVSKEAAQRSLVTQI